MLGGGQEILGNHYSRELDAPNGESTLCAAQCGSESRHLSDVRWCWLCTLALWAIRSGATGRERLNQHIENLQRRGIT